MLGFPLTPEEHGRIVGVVVIKKLIRTLRQRHGDLFSLLGGDQRGPRAARESLAQFGEKRLDVGVEDLCTLSPPGTRVRTGGRSDNVRAPAMAIEAVGDTVVEIAEPLILCVEAKE